MATKGLCGKCRVFKEINERTGLCFRCSFGPGAFERKPAFSSNLQSCSCGSTMFDKFEICQGCGGTPVKDPPPVPMRMPIRHPGLSGRDN